MRIHTCGAVGAAFFDGGPFLHFPRLVSRLLGNKFKTIVGNLRRHGVIT